MIGFYVLYQILGLLELTTMKFAYYFDMRRKGKKDPGLFALYPFSSMKGLINNVDNTGPFKWRWFYVSLMRPGIAATFAPDTHKVKRPVLDSVALRRVKTVIGLPEQCRDRRILCDPHLLKKYGLINEMAEIPPLHPPRSEEEE